SCFITFLDKLDNTTSPDGRLAAMRVMARDAHERVELDKLSASLALMLSEVKSASAVTSAVNVSATKDATVKDDMPSIQELLIRLLEQLVVPQDLLADVEVMKTRLEKETAPSDWQKLLKDVAILINSIRSRMQQEKNEFETFLHQITNRLKELDTYLQTEGASLQKAEQTGKEFDNKINNGVRDIRNDMNQAVDLDGLKQSVQTRLDAISQHIMDYRSAEQTRIAEAQSSVSAMQSRMSSLEQETHNLKTVLVEKNRQALSDALTGIPNRLAYEQRVQDEIGRWKRFGTPLSLVIWDVDYFKKVNDTYGHKAGDKVLKTIAQLMAQRIRNTDFMARFGGEEFVMLLPGTKEEETLRLVNELRKQVEDCGFHYHGTAVKITVSCGVSSFHKDDALAQVFERADKALYRAKKNGRNQCVIAAARSD
ncbi:MAG TPA: diguanylate cyclase, partial [Gammaproteobacteria bacterium]|nr:diguanylate cyclase [Gammaproteobacteria bacterium]